MCFLLSMLVSPSVLFGKWTDHVKSWRHTDLGDRIMYITYEEMVQVKLTEVEFSVFQPLKGPTMWPGDIFDC